MKKMMKKRNDGKLLFRIVFGWIIIFVLFLGGCATFSAEIITDPVLHHYELTVVNMDNEPIEGAKIEFSITEYNHLAGYPGARDLNTKDGIFTTKSDGVLKDSLLIIGFMNRNQSKKSSFSCKVTKNGYYSGNGYMKLTFISGYDTELPVIKDTLTLIRPIDYFDKEFVSSISENALKEDILSFIDLVLLEGIIANTSLDLHSINLIPFKNQNYLQFKFSNSNTYNSLQLNKYDICKILFDEVIRKILNPLNEYVSDSEFFYGYDLTVVGRTKSFAQKYGGLENIYYRFFIPKSAVNEYKDKDISGQQLLNKSVILMDDERIELKLQ